MRPGKQTYITRGGILDFIIRKGFDWRKRLFDSVPKMRTPGEDLPDLVPGIGVDGAIAEPVGPVRLPMGNKQAHYG